MSKEDGLVHFGILRLRFKYCTYRNRHYLPKTEIPLQILFTIF